MSNKKKIYKLFRRKSTESTVKNRNSWTFTIAVLGITGTFCFLLITGKVNIDSSTLLSLILAFFSIYLSAQFYFKATEQSNDFYDRSYTHNRNISESLIEMRGNIDGSFNLLKEKNEQINEKVGRISGLYKETEEEKEKAEDELEKSKEQFLEKYKISEDDFKKFINDVEKVSNKAAALKELEKQRIMLAESADKNFVLTDYLRNSVARRYVNKMKKAHPEKFEDIDSLTLKYLVDEFPSFCEVSNESVLKEAFNNDFSDNRGNVTNEGIISLMKAVRYT